MTDYPGEQFPPAVDPDVEPGEENTEPDYDTEPERESTPDYDTEPGTAQYEPSDHDNAADDSSQYDGADAADEQGHPLVEETMGRLAELRDRPVAEHAEVYADLHERLQSALVEADAGSGDRG